MLEFLKQLLQSVFIWLLLLINGGKLPPELLPTIPDMNIDLSALFGQGSQPQVTMPELPDTSATTLQKARANRLQASLNAVDSTAKALPDTTALSTAGLSSYDSSALAMAGGLNAGLLATDPSARIVNPSGASPSELAGIPSPWRNKGSSSRRTTDNAVATEIIEPAPVEGTGATLGLMALGAGALAVAGYVVVRRRR